MFENPPHPDVQAMHTADVLAFLEHHPDFLRHHADRFGLKQVHDRVVVSLVDRQMLEWKDKVRQLEGRMQQLVRLGEANDLIQARAHRLSLVLIRATSLGTLVDGVKHCFAEEFGLDHMALRLWHPAISQENVLFNGRCEVAQLSRNLSAPYCGPYVTDEVMSWFAPLPVLQSFCQVSLRTESGEPFGVLVLASEDPDRFTFDMHTYYLAQMGELISSALMRTLGPLLPSERA
jgi:hypothetical protein